MSSTKGAVSAFVDSRLENVEQFLDGLSNPPNVMEVDNPESDNESYNTPLNASFSDSSNFVVLEDIGYFIEEDFSDVVMAKPFRAITQLEHDYANGPKQPGNDIDVYLAPLFDDLTTLWNKGVKVYDAYKKENFTLRLVVWYHVRNKGFYNFVLLVQLSTVMRRLSTVKLRIDMHDHLTRFVIVNGDAPDVASASAEGLIPPKIVEQKLARKNKLKAKSTLLLANLDEHLLKFHGIKDAKTLWEAIKTRSEGLDKTYNRFQKVISQLEIHGENVAFVSSENTSSTNEAVNTAYEVSTASSQGQASSSTYADDVMFSFFVNQSNSPQLDNEDLEQVDTDDLEELDLKWQVAMLTMRVKRFLKKTGRNLNFNGKETVGFDKIKVECYNCHMRGHFHC
ncbi:ribonuclease H-like domain-containing protein [Tanacetum coccineum]